MVIYNCIIIGPSSSGKTTIVKHLAKKYNGAYISLDGETASGRPMNSLMSLENTKKFSKEDIGILIRRIMIKEAIDANKKNIPWFIDDIDGFIVKLLPANLRKNTKVILLLPPINMVVHNVAARNKTAHIASEERYVCSVLKQMKKFINVRICKHINKDNKVSKECAPSEINKTFFVISNLDIIKACEHDKIFYSVNEKRSWVDTTNSVLDLYGFKHITSKKLVYAIISPINIDQDITILNDSTLDSIFSRIEEVITKKVSPLTLKKTSKT